MSDTQQALANVKPLPDLKYLNKISKLEENIRRLTQLQTPEQRRNLPLDLIESLTKIDDPTFNPDYLCKRTIVAMASIGHTDEEILEHIRSSLENLMSEHDPKLHARLERIYRNAKDQLELYKANFE